MNGEQPTVPYGHCHCGCGGKTTVAQENDASCGRVLGQPMRFLLGHHPFKRTPPPNPSGLCMCGCGEAAPIAKRTTDGYVKGQYKRFINHHGRRIAERWLPEDRGYLTPCHIWQLRVNDAGYGHTFHDGQYTGAHRVAWIEAHGPIPDGLWVLHKCDQPPCVNVAHLFLGTPTDNMQDMIRKERHGAAKLTAADVVVIRARRATGEVQQRIADDYGITQRMVSAIEHRKVWKHVA